MAKYLILAALIGMLGELDAQARKKGPQEIYFKWKLKKGSTRNDQYIPKGEAKGLFHRKQT